MVALEPVFIHLWEYITMKKVAVFGNAGGGKSTLSQRLADMTGLPWVPLDSIKYQPGGGELPHAEFKAAHDALLQQDQWIVDGFGSLDTVWNAWTWPILWCISICPWCGTTGGLPSDSCKGLG
jgi:hypothetical protein